MAFTQRLSKLFFMGGQGPVTANFTHSLDEQSSHVAYILKQLDEKNLKYVEASSEAERDWINTIVTKARNMQVFRKLVLRVITITKESQMLIRKTILMEAAL